MANINKIQVGSTTYDIEDTVARSQSGWLNSSVKAALLECFEHVAWADANGQTYYNALENALYPPANLSSISAVYTQSGTVYDTDSLDSLRSDLVVTATYEDSSTAIVTNYTLSGTLSEGTSTITTSYGGKTDTFDVTVSTRYTTLLHDWNFANGVLTDTEGGASAVLKALNSNPVPTLESDGVHITANNQGIGFGSTKFTTNQTMIIDIGNSTAENVRGRLVMINTVPSGLGNPTEGFIFDPSHKWSVYKSSAWSDGDYTDQNLFANSSLIIIQYVSDDTYYTDFYKDNTLIKRYTSASACVFDNKAFQIGGTSAAFANIVIKRVRMYEGV